MTQATTVTGPINSLLSNISIYALSGVVTITGNADTISSGASVGLNVAGTDNFISVTSNYVTVNALPSISGGVAADNMVFAGSYGVISDDAFNGGFVTISGNNNNMGSVLDIESLTLVVSGANNTVSSQYETGTVSVSGNNNYVEVGGATVTISGNNDTVYTTNATAIYVTGSGDKVVNQTEVGSAFPYSILFGPPATSPTTPGTLISITGANANVTSYNDNDSITSTGSNATVSALSYVNSLVSSGEGSFIQAAPVDQSITVSGANTTVSTSYLVGKSSTLPGTTVDFTGQGTIGAVYDEGALLINDTVGSATPVEVNLNATNVTVYAGQNYTYTDTIGGNHFSLVAGAHLDIAAGNDTVSLPGSFYFPSETVSGGSVTAPNVIIFGNNDFYTGYANGKLSSYNILDVVGNDNMGIVYAANQDTLNIGGSGNYFSLETNLAAFNSTVTGGVLVTVSGANTVDLFNGGNTVYATNGASLYVTGNGNLITGGGFTLQLQGTDESVVASGSSSITGGSLFTYATNGGQAGTTQNFYTVQSGSFNLGGLDQLVQQFGSAQVSLYGGNAVTLAGGGDTVTVNDQVYGGNTIVDNTAGSTYLLNGISGASATISAAAAATVKASDISGVTARVGGPNYNLDESLTFIARGGNGDSINAHGSAMAVTFAGAAGSNNTVSGGYEGNNSLSGGTGAGDLFVAGGNGDVLIGGTGGANTLVSGTGNETLTGASLSTDLFSITGGGSSLVINGTAGTLHLASGLTMTSETTVGGGLTMLLNDGTQINFTGVTSLTQNGSVFTL